MHRLASAVVLVALLASLGLISGCADDQAARDSVETPDPTAERALEQTALAVAEAFADRDRGKEERTEGWLSQLRGDFEVAAGVKVGNGQAADDGLVLLTHAATSTYKCIAVTEAADIAGEPVKIARISTGQPRC
jgi:hypothetical protein